MIETHRLRKRAALIGLCECKSLARFELRPNGKARTFLSMLLTLCGSCFCHFLLVHHTSKLDGSQNHKSQHPNGSTHDQTIWPQEHPKAPKRPSSPVQTYRFQHLIEDIIFRLIFRSLALATNMEVDTTPLCKGNLVFPMPSKTESPCPDPCSICPDPACRSRFANPPRHRGPE